MNLKDRVFWLTGASSGIGEALAYELNTQGVKLIISARNTAALHRVKQNCAVPENIAVLTLDLSEQDTLPAKANEAMLLFGALDGMIHCAGISQRSLAKETLVAVDRRLMEVNYFAPITLTKALLPYFLQQKKGHLVVITSVVGKYGTPLRSGYAGSKHALHGFFDSLRAENAKDGLKVTLVCPGFIRTNLTMNALTADGSPQQKMDSTTENGILPAHCAKRIVRAMAQEREEIIIAGFKEKLGVYAKRFIPRVFSKVIPHIKVA